MKILLLCVGDELLRGAVGNKNMQLLGDLLFQHGHQLSCESTVNDHFEEIEEAVKRNVGKYDMIITTGGLGPTSDDFTKEAICQTLDLPLELHEEAAAKLAARWRKLGRGELPPYQLKQVMMPLGGELLENRLGTAPGVKITYERCTFFILPGPPREMMPMAKEYLLPFVKQSSEQTQFCHVYHLAELPESKAEAAVTEILEDFPDVTPAYCADPRVIKLFFRAADEKILYALKPRLQAAFGSKFLQPDCVLLEEEIIALLHKENLSLATAESCTGGLIGGRLTSVSGASEHYLGGIIAYSNVIKENIIGVDHQVLAEHGAVSEECAYEMAVKTKKKFACDCAVSVTGIAGPGGGSKEKPVGLVYIGVAVKEKCKVKKYQFRGDREGVRDQTVFAALADLRQMIKKNCEAKSSAQR